MAAIGIISASQWITYHGLVMKVTSDPSPFNWIVPCGTQYHQVRSIKRLLEKNKSSNGFKETDLDPPDDCQLIDITHDSVIMEFSEVSVFQLEVLEKNILIRDFRYKLLAYLIGNY